MRYEDMGLTRFPQHGNMPIPSMRLPPWSDTIQSISCIKDVQTLPSLTNQPAGRFWGEPNEHNLYDRWQSLQCWRDSPSPAALNIKGTISLGYHSQFKDLCLPYGPYRPCSTGSSISQWGENRAENSYVMLPANLCTIIYNESGCYHIY